MNHPRLVELSAELDAIFSSQQNILLPKSIEDSLFEREKETSTMAIEHLESAIALYDIGLQALISFHKAFEQAQDKNRTDFSYVVLTAKICSLLLAIRKMLMSGMVDASKCLMRPLFETVDIFYVCLIDTEFSKRYGNIDQIYDNKKFWSQNINANKTKQNIRNLFIKLEIENAHIKSFFKSREASQDFLSNSLHGSFNSAFSNYMTYELDGSGLSKNIFGKVTVAYPRLLISLLNEMLTILQVIDLSSKKNLDSLYYFKKIDCSVFEYYLSKYENLFPMYINEIVNFYEENNVALLSGYGEVIQDEKPNEIKKIELITHKNHLLARVEVPNFLVNQENIMIFHEFWNDKEMFRRSLNEKETEGNPDYDHVRVRAEHGLSDEEAINLFKELNGI